MREKKQKLADNERDLERRQNESTTRLQQLKKELEVINNVFISSTNSYYQTCLVQCCVNVWHRSHTFVWIQVKKAAYDQERTDWESANNVTIEDLKRMSLESLDGKKKSKVISSVYLRKWKKSKTSSFRPVLAESASGWALINEGSWDWHWSERSPNCGLQAFVWCERAYEGPYQWFGKWFQTEQLDMKWLILRPESGLKCQYIMYWLTKPIQPTWNMLSPYYWAKHFLSNTMTHI